MSDTDVLETAPVPAHEFLPGDWFQPPSHHGRPRRAFGWAEAGALAAGLVILPAAFLGAYHGTMWWRHFNANPVIVGTASPSPHAVAPARHHRHHSVRTLPRQPVNQTAPAGGIMPQQPAPLPPPPAHEPRHHHPPPVSPPPSPLPSPSPSPSPSPDPSPTTPPPTSPPPTTVAASPT